MRRRSFLYGATGALGSAGALGPVGGIAAADPDTTTTPAEESTPTGTSDAGPPVVDNAGAVDETVTVDVLVVDRTGDPVAGVTVKLEDRGGTPDDRFGRTGPGGRIRFLESVGPPPCNTQTVKLPDFGLSVRLGCNDGGVSLDHVFTVDADEASTAPGATPTVPAGTPTPAVRGPGPGDGYPLDGLVRAASWLVGVTLAGPLVLGLLVAVAERASGADGSATDGPDGS